ncbi:hypothetical protein GCM10023187_43870 [Nibrella viscosa]|uniref:Uncharacterized protein n=1 Tax=Nibrella viscosa TaxID=1084524 RepID=A0ABP8KSK3_9BACT
MKRSVFLSLVISSLVISLVALFADEPFSKLNGAFRQVRYKYGAMTNWGSRDSVTVIKVFRDGYWLGAFYDDKRQSRYDEKTAGIRSFNGACGGTYELKGGKYIETVNFYSWDSTAVGNTFAFDYKVSGLCRKAPGVATVTLERVSTKAFRPSRFSTIQW